MTVLFGGGEASAVQPASLAVESTTASSFRSANSRLSLSSASPVNFWTIDAGANITDGSFKVQWWTNFIDTDDSDHFLLLSNGSGTGQLRLNCGSNGTVMGLQYWTGAAWAQVGSTFNPGVYSSVMTEIVIRFTCGASGTAELFFNGVSKAAGSIGSATTNIRTAKMFSPDVNATWYFSEGIFENGTQGLIGSVVETEAPTANGTDNSDGTGSYTDIDETITTDADRITLTAAGQKRSFTSPARTSTLAEVLGVTVAARMSRGTSGPQNFKFYLLIGGTRYYGPTTALGLGYAAYQYTWATNPSTGLQWTTAEANDAALQWGVEAVA